MGSLQLQVLDLYSNNISNISALENSNTIQKLDLRSNKIQNYSAIINHVNYKNYKLDEQK
ncbi:Leucine-rich_repeat domain superfamily [Hexamita inflata]|uniref:Leucine-rich repeat domain superfamily n=1 Tax=Hexamita inflata TaxID=28002 RepID=A0AA86VHP6_9EUKA|nr:Leucine-rich repeat domain superfamily [Hexamita inflata]